jgi:hypothetical protein
LLAFYIWVITTRITMKDRLLNGHHLSLQQQTELLSEFMLSIDDMPKILAAITKLPNAWLGAGVIFQNVWNVMHGFAPYRYIKDILITHNKQLRFPISSLYLI